MSKLVFLYNVHEKRISWLIADDSERLLKKGHSKDLSEVYEEGMEVKGFIFSPQFTSKRLEVPPTSKKQIMGSIPFLLEDHLIGSIEDYHFVSSSRNKEGEILVSLIPITTMEQEVNDLHNEEFFIHSLSPLETAFKGEPGQSFMVILKDLSILSLGSNGGYCAETTTILEFLETELIESNTSSLKVFQDKKTEHIDWKSYTKVKVDIEFFEDEVDFLKKVSPLLNDNLNLLQNSFAPKVMWSKYFHKWKYVLAGFLLVVTFYFLQITLEIYQNNSAALKLVDQSKSLYYSAFPNEPKNRDLKTQLSKKFRNNVLIKEPFLITVQNITEVITNNENVSLYSMVYDRNKNQIIVELQCAQFEDLENIKSIFLEKGYLINVGSSKRVGNSILSEIFLQKS